jgi:hypothetical protein
MILTDIKFLYDGRDLSADGNAIELEETYEMLNKTNLTNSFNCFRPGLPEGKWSYKGFTAFGIGSIEETLKNRRDLATGIPVIVAKTAALGSRAHFFSAAQGPLSMIQGPVGQILGFTVEGTFGRSGAASSAGLISGPVLEPGVVSRVIAGSSTPVAMPGPVVGRSLWATVHLVAFVGTTITFKIQSAALVGFGSPTDRFTQVLTAVGGAIPTPVAGPITDGFYRADWSGTFTSFTAVVIVGVR